MPTPAPYTEASYQKSIIGHLVHAGYKSHKAVYRPQDVPASPGSVFYDQHRAVIPAEFSAFVEQSQPDEWAELASLHGADTGTRVVEALVEALDQKGIVWVLRRGIKVSDQTLQVVGFKPTDAGTQTELRRYKANRFVVIEELKFNPLHVVDDLGDHRMRLDLVLFLNGIPIITAELKNQLTGQTVANAIEQYQNTRQPTAPIFRYPFRTLVQFVVYKRRAFMTTRLDGVHTRWFPYDRGWNNSLGNPPADKGGGLSGVEHLWRETWTPDALLELVQRYTALLPHPDPEQSWGALERLRRGTLVFPRYHQRRTVRRIVTETLQSGVGRHFLVQHSTGSGKSLTLGWLAHELATLHDAGGHKVFDRIIVISDRQVVVGQLQTLVEQLSFGKAADEVLPITGKSSGLTEALNGTVPVIVCTIHRFSYIQKDLVKAARKRFAVIVDEAHSSQHGTLSEELVAALQGMEEHGTKNISFFAFTATPKDATLQHFGDPKGDTWVPFDTYSMKQAREEGFIVDVLQHYVSWRQEMDASAVARGDTQVKGTTANVFEILSNDPKAIDEKADEIVSHYLGVVHGQLAGHARAMVVANGRDAARLYFEAIRRKLHELGRDDVKLLVAFSGLLTDDEESNSKLTEEKLNGGVGGSEIPKRLRKDHHILVVANKYQTGFDEPRLVAMYLDKGIRGISAVQTLSRLNRPYPGKGPEGMAPVVIDFYNDPEQVYNAFREYDQTYSPKYYLPEDILDQIADELDASGVYEVEWSDRALELLEQPAGASDEVDGLHNQCIERFEGLPTDDDRSVFRHRLLRFLSLFCSAYYLSTTKPESRFRLRSRRALYSVLKAEIEAWKPGQGPIPPVSITKNHVALEAYQLICQGKMPAPTWTGADGGDAPDELGVGNPKDAIVQTLEEVVQAFNVLFGIQVTADLVPLLNARVVDATHGRESLRSAAASGRLSDYRRIYREELANVLIDLQDDEKLGPFADKLLDEMDKTARGAVDQIAGLSFDSYRAA